MESGGQLLDLWIGVDLIPKPILPNGWKDCTDPFVHASSINNAKEVGNPRPTAIGSSEKLLCTLSSVNCVR